MTEIKKELSYYEKNKDKIQKYYQENKDTKTKYNKEYYQKIKKEKRTTWEYYQYQKNYYRLKKLGMRPSDIKKKTEFLKKQNNHIVKFD